MSANTTAAPTSASPFMPSSSTVFTSPEISPMSSSISSVTSGWPTTSSPQTTIRPTTSSTTTARGTARSSTQTLSSTTFGGITSLTSTTSTSDTPFTTAMPSSAQGSPAVPLTTVTESTTVFITSTNSDGQLVTSIPPVVTEVITTTENGGIVTTITQAVVNPTLAPHNGTTGVSPFFANTGAVVGVFAVVGLASASILLWILFAVRHRQRMKRLEQNTAVEAIAAGLNRALLDDDYEDASLISPSTNHLLSSEMGQRSNLFGLANSGSLTVSAHVPDDTVKDGSHSQTDHAVRHMTNHPMGHVPTRTTSTEPFPDGSSRDRKSSYGHTPTYSAGSFEPLLANYLQATQDQDSSPVAVQPQRDHPSQHQESGSVQGYLTDESLENRLTPNSQRQSSSGSFVLQDEEDRARYVLMVRNIPDDHSQHSL